MRVHSAYAPGGRTDEFTPRACIACRHYAIDWNPYEPPTRQETWGFEASFGCLSVHSTHKGRETRGNCVSREETALLSIREPYPTCNPRPLMALLQRFRSCTGTSVLSNSPGLVPQWSGDMQIKLEKMAHALEHTLERPHPKFQPGARNLHSDHAALHRHRFTTLRVTCNSRDCDRIPSRWHRCVKREVNQTDYTNSVTSYV